MDAKELDQEIARLTKQAAVLSGKKDMIYQEFSSTESLDKWNEFNQLKEELQNVLHKLTVVKAEKSRIVPSYWVEYEHKVPYVMEGQFYTQICTEPIHSKIDIQIDKRVESFNYKDKNQMNLLQDLYTKIWQMRGGEISIRKIVRAEL